MLLPPDEEQRLQALEKYKLEGIGREPAFDHVTEFATGLFDVPIALVSIVGSDMQCFRGACGLDASGTSRDIAFCAFAILQPEVMIVQDATRDPRFQDNPLVLGDPFIRFYAGAPLRVKEGHAVGTLCLADTKPRAFSQRDAERLAQLARTVIDLIELRVDRFAVEEHREQVAAERELLKLTVENASEGVALFDGDLRLILWNEVFTRFFDYPPELMAPGVHATTLMGLTAKRGELGEGTAEEVMGRLVQSIRSNDSGHIELNRRDGRMLDIRRRTISGGRFILTARDVTNERQVARLKDEIISTVSHELRTPLTAIAGALGLVGSGAAGALPDKAGHLVTVANRNVGRLTTLVNDLLDMDKLRSGKQAFHFAQHDLNAITAELVEQNAPFAERFQITIEADCPADPVIARVDRDRLVQVMTNLISNAAKFSPAGGVVTVRLERAGDEALLSVIDQGPGISPDFIERIFRRFSQEDGAHQKGRSGTGLGLAISKSIVDQHGGTIEIESELGAGSTFRVRLPIAGPAETQA